VAICGSGVGASVCANKIPGIRDGLVHDHLSARQGVEDDHMNIICMGGRTIGPLIALELVETFLGAGSVRPGAAWVKWLPWSWKCPPQDNQGEIT
jgi:RpiB/LacA/LacB family sugar-phosphate isomerase